MKYDFDRVIERRGTDSHKWKKYGEDVIPLWVADMDFISAEPIMRAMHQRIDDGIFGYSFPPAELYEAIQRRLKVLYGWHIDQDSLIFLPGIVPGLNVAFQAYADPGESVLVQPPVYFHFLKDPVCHGRGVNDPPMVRKGDTYEIDFDRFEASISDRTRLFVLCNPHNPVGRVYTREELEKLAGICLHHRLTICSDEIHCDLLYPGYHHIPIATLGPEVAERTVTLMAPSKTYNLAGLRCGFAVIEEPGLRTTWKNASLGIVSGVNILGHVAALAALRDGQEWLDQVLVYLGDNRDFLARSLKNRLPGLQMCRIEATYLAWIDCRDSGIQGNPAEFFLKEAKVGLNDGLEFGTGGEGFVRLNFACPRKILHEALDRMAAALESI